MQEETRQGMLSRITQALSYVASNAEQQKRIADALEQISVTLTSIESTLDSVSIDTDQLREYLIWKENQADD
jgi:truncated hemoglobin YjbI